MNCGDIAAADAGMKFKTFISLEKQILFLCFVNNSGAPMILF